MKKLPVILFALLLCVSMFACAGNDEDSSSSSSLPDGSTPLIGDNEIDIDSILPN